MGDCSPRLNFLGLPDEDGVADIIIAPVPYELTTSYGQGTIDGPKACIEASQQVELYDDLLGEELPAGKVIKTVDPWDGEGGSLQEQLDGIAKYSTKLYDSGAFPVFLGGEHGILPAILRGCPQKVTLIQIDAHADLRSELDGDPYSHACSISRSLDEGALAVHQIGVRAYCLEELEMIKNDDRIHTAFARDITNPLEGELHWSNWLSSIEKIKGPVHLTIDIDGLDGSYVPATGTPVPNGLYYNEAFLILKKLIENRKIIGIDYVEYSPIKNFHAYDYISASIVYDLMKLCLK